MTGWRMQACYLTITTTADGEESTVVKEGELSFGVRSTELRYKDGGSVVTLFAQGQSVTIDRQGDYSFFLPLECGESTVGTLGIGGAEGELSLYTHKAQYVVGEASFLLLLEYDMIMGGGTQKMKLRLHARLK